MLQALKSRHAYGYENVEIPEALCRAVYDRYLPLSMWDDEELRYSTSVTEQGASLVRLVWPEYHCRAVRLAENTFVHDFRLPSELLRNQVMILPAASGRYKHWGNGNYLALARKLEERGYRPLFLLGPGELDYAEEFQSAGFPCLSGLSFAQVAALMNAPSRTSCVIGNDTGLMHLACALDAPSITVSPDEAHFTWFPYSRERHAVCHPECSCLGCGRGGCPEAYTPKCLERVTVETVLETFERLCGSTNEHR